MTRAGILICGISLAFGITEAAIIYRTNDLWMLLSLLLLIPFLIALVFSIFLGFRLYKKLGVISSLPLAVALISLFILPGMGLWLRDSYFRERLPELAQYALKTVSERKSQTVDGFSYPTSYHEDHRGYMSVYFPWGGCFPVKHQILAYLESDETLSDPEFQADWQGVHKVADHWFVLHD